MTERPRLVRIGPMRVGVSWRGRPDWVVPSVAQWSDRFTVELVLPDAGAVPDHEAVAGRRRRWTLTAGSALSASAVACGERAGFFFVHLTFPTEETAPVGSLVLTSYPEPGAPPDLDLVLADVATAWVNAPVAG